MYGKRIFFILGMVLLLSKSNSQNAEAYIALDTNAMMIGDQVNLQIGIKLPEDFVVNWPLLGDSLSENIEIISKTAIDSTLAEKIKLLKQNLSITSFDSGYFEIPSIEFSFHHKNDPTIYTAKTNVLFLMVNIPVVDTAQAFKAIKGPISEPYTFKEMLPWIGLGLALIAIVYFLVWYIRKRRKNQPVFQKKAKPRLPPHVIAINKLEELRLAKVWQQGKIKEYHTELTDIIREYFENRYQFDAMEMTSEEIIDSINEQKINDEVLSKLKNALQLADLVKFAKAQPTSLENDLSMNHCIDFVNETKLIIFQDENGNGSQKIENKE